MIRKAYLTLVFLLVVCAGAFAQSGAIRGKILDKANKQPIPFATVIAEMNGTQVSGGQSDFDGEYIIKPLSAAPLGCFRWKSIALSLIVGVGNALAAQCYWSVA